MKSLCILFFALSLLFFYSLAPLSALSPLSPLAPLFPSTFNVTFVETTTDLLGRPHQFNGTWFYDADNQRERIDRDTGAYDRYCGSVRGDVSSGGCRHIVLNETRYLWWPNSTDNFCCKCCTAQNGCGIVKTTWMRDASGSYVNRSVVDVGALPSGYSGVIDTWLIKGLQSNYWSSDVVSGYPVQFLQVPNDYQYFNLDTYHANVTFDDRDDTFMLPDTCSASCPLLSVCTVAAE